MQARFFRSLFLLLLLNLLVKPIWIFLIDRKVQLLTGDAYGQYFSLMHLALIIGIVADAGILAFYSRTVAANPLQAPRYFRYFIRVKILLSAICFLVASLIILLVQPRQAGIFILLALLQAVASLYLFLRSHISALQLFTADAFFSVADKAMVILAAGSMIYLVPESMVKIDTKIFIWIQVAALVASGIAALVFLSPHLKLKEPVDLTGYRKELKKALPYAAVVLVMTVLYRFDAFLLYFLHSDGAVEASKYAAGFRLLDAVNMIGFLLASFLLPLLSRGGDRNSMIGVVKNSTGIMLLYACCIAAFCFIHQNEVWHLLYNRSFYRGSENVLGISLLAVVGCSVVHIYGTVLTASGTLRPLTICAVFFAVLNVIANLFVIPAYGAAGVAAVSASSQLAFAVSLVIICYRHKMTVPVKRYWIAALLLPFIVYGMFMLTGSLSLAVQLIVVAPGAFVFSIALRLVSLDMIKTMLSGNNKL